MNFNKLPLFVKKSAYNIFLMLLKIRDNSLNNKKISGLDLKVEHLKNTKVLINRSNLLENLPKNSICAEIGVNKGDFSEQILTTCKPNKLHVIDSWASDRYDRSVESHFRNRYKNEIEDKLIVIDKGISTEVLNTYDDFYFDWVYLDTSHSYETTSIELQLLSKKVKENGIISGHDYVTRSRTNAMKYGVIEAVHEFCNEANYEIIFITLEWNGHNSFALKKLVS